MSSESYDNPRVKWQELMEHINLMKEVVDVIWKKENYDRPIERFYYTIFLKLLYILDGIHINIFNLDHKPHYEVVTVLSLRTAMLDILNLYYVIDVHENITEAENRINAIMADHLKYIYNELTLQEKKEARKSWPELFDEQGLLKYSGHVGTKHLLAGIRNCPNLVDEAHQIQHIYKLFSKYEHNGAFTFDLLHSMYKPNGSGLKRYMIYYAISACAIASKLISSHWLEDSMPLALKLNDSIKKLTVFSSPKNKKKM